MSVRRVRNAPLFQCRRHVGVVAQCDRRGFARAFVAIVVSTAVLAWVRLRCGLPWPGVGCSDCVERYVVGARFYCGGRPVLAGLRSCRLLYSEMNP